MPTAVTTGFDPEQHLLDGNGWVNSYPDGSGAIISTHFATLTLAHAAAQDILSDDATIHGVLLDQTRTEFLAIAGNVTTVDANLSSKRISEGLDGPYP